MQEHRSPGQTLSGRLFCNVHVHFSSLSVLLPIFTLYLNWVRKECVAVLIEFHVLNLIFFLTGHFTQLTTYTMAYSKEVGGLGYAARPPMIMGRY